MAAGLPIYRATIFPRSHRTFWLTAATIVTLLSFRCFASADPRADDPHLGIIEYEISCMPCHGIDGHGDGRRASSLKTVPADLTKIAKSNKGEFPTQKVAGIIDGRAIVAAHGPREMPVWGDRYRTRSGAYETAAEIEQRARAQIAALVRYLKTIQEK